MQSLLQSEFCLHRFILICAFFAVPENGELVSWCFYTVSPGMSFDINLSFFIWDTSINLKHHVVT